jgi:hypothetical protein
LSDYPSSVLPSHSNKPLLRIRKNQNLTLANAHIYIFDNWANHSPGSRQATITHEVAHNLGNQFGLDNCDHWMTTAGWKKRVEIDDGNEAPNFELINSSLTPSKYAQTNPSEDFAESVVAYRYRANEFKRRSPEKYQFIKESVFDGVEFSSQSVCENANTLSQKLAQEIINKNNQSKPDAILLLLPLIEEKCSQETIDVMLKVVDSPRSLDQCMNRVIAESLIADDDFQGIGVTRIESRQALTAQVLNKLKDSGFNQKYFGEYQKSFSGKVEEFILDIESKSNFRYVLAKNKNESKVEDFCEKYISGAWTHGKDTIFVNTKNKSSLAYRNKQNLEDVARQVCIIVQEENIVEGEIRPMSKDRIRLAIGRVLNN